MNNEEMQEIADGAWGDDPRVCGMARDQLKKAIELTSDELLLLEWLSTDDGQYGECYGKTLDGLLARGLAAVQGAESGLQNGFIAKGTDIMYRAVSITDAGRAALREGSEG